MKKTDTITILVARVFLLGAGQAFASTLDESQKFLPSDGAAQAVFGHAVSVSGNEALIGAPWDSETAIFAGAVYVFRWNGSSWEQVQKLLASDGAAADHFGFSVSVAGDVAVIGAPEDQNVSGPGAAYVFRNIGGTWMQEAKLVASDGAALDFFGTSVSVFGDVAVVGAPFDDDNGADSGSAYAFRNDGGSWTQDQKMLPEDGAAGDEFGHSVSVAFHLVFDEFFAIIGAWHDDDLGSNSGSAYAFRRHPVKTTWGQEDKILPSDGTLGSGGNFGVSTTVSSDGIAVIGAHLASSRGAVYVFSDGTQLPARSRGSWVQLQRLAPSGVPTAFLFGFSVSMFDRVVVIGAMFDESNGPQSGAAYLFRDTGGAYVEEHKLLPSDGGVGDSAGWSVSVSGHAAFVGAYFDDDNGTNSGSAYVFSTGCDEAATCQLHGDAFPVGPPTGNCVIDVDDILEVLRGFADGAVVRPWTDIFPCGGNGVVDVDDILSVLRAFAGDFDCPHPCSP